MSVLPNPQGGPSPNHGHAFEPTLIVADPWERLKDTMNVKLFTDGFEDCDATSLGLALDRWSPRPRAHLIRLRGRPPKVTSVKDLDAVEKEKVESVQRAAQPRSWFLHFAHVRVLWRGPRWLDPRSNFDLCKEKGIEHTITNSIRCYDPVQDYSFLIVSVHDTDGQKVLYWDQTQSRGARLNLTFLSNLMDSNFVPSEAEAASETVKGADTFGEQMIELSWDVCALLLLHATQLIDLKYGVRLKFESIIPDQSATLLGRHFLNIANSALPSSPWRSALVEAIIEYHGSLYQSWRRAGLRQPLTRKYHEAYTTSDFILALFRFAVRERDSDTFALACMWSDWTPFDIKHWEFLGEALEKDPAALEFPREGFGHWLSYLLRRSLSVNSRFRAISALPQNVLRERFVPQGTSIFEFMLQTNVADLHILVSSSILRTLEDGASLASGAILLSSSPNYIIERVVSVVSDILKSHSVDQYGEKRSHFWVLGFLHRLLSAALAGKEGVKPKDALSAFDEVSAFFCDTDRFCDHHVAGHDSGIRAHHLTDFLCNLCEAQLNYRLHRFLVNLEAAADKIPSLEDCKKFWLPVFDLLLLAIGPLKAQCAGAFGAVLKTYALKFYDDAMASCEYKKTDEQLARLMCEDVTAKEIDLLLSGRFSGFRECLSDAYLAEIGRLGFFPKALVDDPQQARVVDRNQVAPNNSARNANSEEAGGVKCQLGA